MSTPATARSANVEAVQTLYEAFGRGDLETILDLLAEDVSWEEWADWFPQRAGVPWFEHRNGRDGVAEFFRIVGEFEITEFAVLDVMAGDNQVAAQIVIDASMPNGGRLRDEELHLWSFDANGKIRGMRHYVDTAKHIAAAGGEDTTAR